MEQILRNIYHVGDNGCSVYLVDSGQGLVPPEDNFFNPYIKEIP